MFMFFRFSSHMTGGEILSCSTAEADGVEEAAVARGMWVTAAKLGQAGLFKLRAAGFHRFGFHFGSRRRQNVIPWNRDHFGLLKVENSTKSETQ